MMAGKENSAMTILADFAKPCKGKLLGSVVLAVLGALCGMIPYIAVSRGIIMICHEDYAFSKLAFLALIAFTGYLGQVWFGTFSTMKSHESAFIILRNIRMAITEKLSRVPMGTILDTPSGKFKTIIVDTVEKLELPLAHMVPELTANILIPILISKTFVWVSVMQLVEDRKIDLETDIRKKTCLNRLNLSLKALRPSLSAHCVQAVCLLFHPLVRVD